MTALSYNQVALVPRYSTLRSRSEADVSVEFLGRRLVSPVLCANMESVINESIAKWLSESGHGYIYHRFGDTYSFVRRANQEGWKLVSISVGVKQVDRYLLEQIAREGLRVDWITIDIAHGHHVLVKEMIQFIRDIYALYSSCPKIIAGNVATPEAVRDLAEWGADCVKCGVAGGAACHTKQKTGFHIPMFTCAKECAENGGPLLNVSILPKGSILQQTQATVPLIFDGGVREIGDVAKALVAGGGGPNLVMAGSLFAACTDAPGENVYEDVPTNPLGWTRPDLAPRFERKFTKKRFHGSASSRQKGEHKHVEGVELEIPCNGMTVEELYQDIRESLQSACSYAGSTNLAGLKDVQYVEVK